MSYSCSNCSKTFSSKKYLLRHVSNQVCTKQHFCNKCGKEFSNGSNLRAHLSKKTSCVPTQVPVIDTTKDENKCHYCGKCYASPYNLKRHVGSCPMKDNKDAMIKLMMEQNQELISIIKEKGLGGQVTNNITNNTLIQNNMYVNVTFCSFGSEDLSRLDTNKVMQLLKGQVKDFMPKMMEHVHANPDHPEFHNVFYDPERQKAIVFVPISDTEMSWQSRDFSEVSADIRKKIKDHMRPGVSPYFDNAMKAKDTDTANKIIQIANEVKYDAPEDLEQQKESLTQVTKNKEFMKLVDVVE